MKAYRISELERLGPFKRAKLYEEIRLGKLVAHKGGTATFVFEKDWQNYLATLPRLPPASGGSSGGAGLRAIAKKRGAAAR